MIVVEMISIGVAGREREKFLKAAVNRISPFYYPITAAPAGDGQAMIALSWVLHEFSIAYGVDDVVLFKSFIYHGLTPHHVAFYHNEDIEEVQHGNKGRRLLELLGSGKKLALQQKSIISELSVLNIEVPVEISSHDVVGGGSLSMKRRGQCCWLVDQSECKKVLFDLKE